jgi:hypothetical protein
MKRPRSRPQRALIDRHRIIETLAAAVHSTRQEADSAAWGISPIETYLKDILDFAGPTAGE